MSSPRTIKPTCSLCYGLLQRTFSPNVYGVLPGCSWSVFSSQTNNSAQTDTDHLSVDEPLRLSPNSFLIPSINSSPSHRLDQPCTCLHCRYMGKNRARTLSPASVRSPDPTITEIYNAKSFTLSPDLSQRDLVSDSYELGLPTLHKTPTAGGVWAWDTRYIPPQRTESPWLPSGMLSRLYLKRYTCCRCGKFGHGSYQRRLRTPDGMPCCKAVLRRRRHRRYVLLRSSMPNIIGGWQFSPDEKIPELFPDDDCAGHCQLLGKDQLTFGDSSIDQRRTKSSELTAGKSVTYHSSDRTLSPPTYLHMRKALCKTTSPLSQPLQPIAYKDVQSKSTETKPLRFVSPTKESRSKHKSKRCPKDLILPVLSPPLGPTDTQMVRILRRQCHQRVIAFNDSDGIFYPGLVQKCVSPESSIIRFRHNGILSEVPNQLTLPVTDMLHTQPLNDGDTVLVRVKNLNEACECWIPARVTGGFLGSPDPRYPLRHRYQIRLFSGAKHVFRRRDILRISPLFYKSLIEYIKVKRGTDVPEQPVATGEGEIRARSKTRKRKRKVEPPNRPHPVVSPRLLRPKQVKKEPELNTPPEKEAPKGGDVIIPRPFTKRIPEKRDKPVTSPEKITALPIAHKPLGNVKPPSVAMRPARVIAKPAPPPSLPPARPAPPRTEPLVITPRKPIKEESKPAVLATPTPKPKPKKPPPRKPRKVHAKPQMNIDVSAQKETPDELIPDVHCLPDSTIIDTYPFLLEERQDHIVPSLKAESMEQMVDPQILEQPGDAVIDQMSVQADKTFAVNSPNETQDNEEMKQVDKLVVIQQEEYVPAASGRERSADILSACDGTEEPKLAESFNEPSKDVNFYDVQENVKDGTSEVDRVIREPSEESNKQSILSVEQMAAEDRELSKSPDTKRQLPDDDLTIELQDGITGHVERPESLSVKLDDAIEGEKISVDDEKENVAVRTTTTTSTVQDEVVREGIAEDKTSQKRTYDETVREVTKQDSPPHTELEPTNTADAYRAMVSDLTLKAKHKTTTSNQKPDEVSSGPKFTKHIRDEARQDICSPDPSDVEKIKTVSISEVSTDREPTKQLQVLTAQNEVISGLAKTANLSSKNLRKQLNDADIEGTVSLKASDAVPFRPIPDNLSLVKQDVSSVTNMSAQPIPLIKPAEFSQKITENDQFVKQIHDERSGTTTILQDTSVKSIPTVPVEALSGSKENDRDANHLAHQDAKLFEDVQQHRVNSENQFEKQIQDETVNDLTLPATLSKSSVGLEPSDLASEVQEPNVPKPKAVEQKLEDDTLKSKVGNMFQNQIHDESVEQTNQPEPQSLQSIRSPSSVVLATELESDGSVISPTTKAFEELSTEQRHISVGGRWRQQLHDEEICRIETPEIPTVSLLRSHSSTEYSSKVESIKHHPPPITDAQASMHPDRNHAKTDQTWVKQIRDEQINQISVSETSVSQPVDVISQSGQRSIEREHAHRESLANVQIPIEKTAQQSAVDGDRKWTSQIHDESIDVTTLSEAPVLHPLRSLPSVVVPIGELHETPADQITAFGGSGKIVHEKDISVIKGQDQTVDQKPQPQSTSVHSVLPTIGPSVSAEDRELEVVQLEADTTVSMNGQQLKKIYSTLQSTSQEINKTGELEANAQITAHLSTVSLKPDVFETDELPTRGGLERLTVRQSAAEIWGDHGRTVSPGFHSGLRSTATTLMDNKMENTVVNPLFERDDMIDKQADAVVPSEKDESKVVHSFHLTYPSDMPKKPVDGKSCKEPYAQVVTIQPGGASASNFEHDLLIQDLNITYREHVELSDEASGVILAPDRTITLKAQYATTTTDGQLDTDVPVMVSPPVDEMLAERWASGVPYEHGSLNEVLPPPPDDRPNQPNGLDVDGTALPNLHIELNVTLAGRNKPDRTFLKQFLLKPEKAAESTNQAVSVGSTNIATSISVAQREQCEPSFTDHENSEGVETYGATSPTLFSPVSRPHSVNSYKSTLHTQLTYSDRNMDSVQTTATIRLNNPSQLCSSSRYQITNRFRSRSCDSVLEEREKRYPNAASNGYDIYDVRISQTIHTRSSSAKPAHDERTQCQQRQTDTQTRRRRVQAAEVAARAALADSGQTLGFVSKYSLEIRSMAEDVYLDPSRYHKQKMDENVFIVPTLSTSPVECSSSPSYKLNPDELPLHPKRIGLTYLSQIDVEPLVVDGGSLVHRNIVHVMRDASIVDMDLLESLSVTSLVVPKEVAISNEYEFEVEKTGSKSMSVSPTASTMQLTMDAIEPSRHECQNLSASQSPIESRDPLPIRLVPAVCDAQFKNTHMKVDSVFNTTGRKPFQVSAKLEQLSYNVKQAQQPTTSSRELAHYLTDASRLHDISFGKALDKHHNKSSISSSLVSTSTVEIVLKTETSDQILLDLAEEPNVCAYFTKYQMARPMSIVPKLENGCGSQRFRPTERQNFLGDVDHVGVKSQTRLASYAIRMALSVNDENSTSPHESVHNKTYPVYVPDRYSVKPLIWKQESSVSHSREAHPQPPIERPTTPTPGLQKHTWFDSGKPLIQKTNFEGEDLSDEITILNLAVSIVYVDEGEIEVITRIDVRNMDNENDRLPSEILQAACGPDEGVDLACEPECCPQTLAELDSTAESTVAPKSATLNMSSITKIDHSATNETEFRTPVGADLSGLPLNHGSQNSLSAVQNEHEPVDEEQISGDIFEIALEQNMRFRNGELQVESMIATNGSRESVRAVPSLSIKNINDSNSHCSCTTKTKRNYSDAHSCSLPKINHVIQFEKPEDFYLNDNKKSQNCPALYEVLKADDSYSTVSSSSQFGSAGLSHSANRSPEPEDLYHTENNNNQGIKRRCSSDCSLRVHTSEHTEPPPVNSEKQKYTEGNNMSSVTTQAMRSNTIMFPQMHKRPSSRPGYKKLFSIKDRRLIVSLPDLQCATRYIRIGQPSVLLISGVHRTTIASAICNDHQTDDVLYEYIQSMECYSTVMCGFSYAPACENKTPVFCHQNKPWSLARYDDNYRQSKSSPSFGLNTQVEKQINQTNKKSNRLETNLSNHVDIWLAQAGISVQGTSLFVGQQCKPRLSLGLTLKSQPILLPRQKFKQTILETNDTHVWCNLENFTGTSCSNSGEFGSGYSSEQLTSDISAGFRHISKPSSYDPILLSTSRRMRRKRHRGRLLVKSQEILQQSEAVTSQLKSIPGSNLGELLEELPAKITVASTYNEKIENVSSTHILREYVHGVYLHHMENMRLCLMGQNSLSCRTSEQIYELASNVLINIESHLNLSSKPRLVTICSVLQEVAVQHEIALCSSCITARLGELIFCTHINHSACLPNGFGTMKTEEQVHFTQLESIDKLHVIQGCFNWDVQTYCFLVSDKSNSLTRDTCNLSENDLIRYFDLNLCSSKTSSTAIASKTDLSECLQNKTCLIAGDTCSRQAKQDYVHHPSDNGSSPQNNDLFEDSAGNFCPPSPTQTSDGIDEPFDDEEEDEDITEATLSPLENDVNFYVLPVASRQKTVFVERCTPPLVHQITEADETNKVYYLSEGENESLNEYVHSIEFDSGNSPESDSHKHRSEFQRGVKKKAKTATPQMVHMNRLTQESPLRHIGSLKQPLEISCFSSSSHNTFETVEIPVRSPELTTKRSVYADTSKLKPHYNRLQPILFVALEVTRQLFEAERGTDTNFELPSDLSNQIIPVCFVESAHMVDEFYSDDMRLLHAIHFTRDVFLFNLAARWYTNIISSVDMNPFPKTTYEVHHSGHVSSLGLVHNLLSDGVPEKPTETCFARTEGTVPAFQKNDRFAIVRMQSIVAHLLSAVFFPSIIFLIHNSARVAYFQTPEGFILFHSYTQKPYSICEVRRIYPWLYVHATNRLDYLQGSQTVGLTRNTLVEQSYRAAATILPMIQQDQLPRLCMLTCSSLSKNIPNNDNSKSTGYPEKQQLNLSSVEDMCTSPCKNNCELTQLALFHSVSKAAPNSIDVLHNCSDEYYSRSTFLTQLETVQYKLKSIPSNLSVESQLEQTTSGLGSKDEKLPFVFREAIIGSTEFHENINTDKMDEKLSQVVHEFFRQDHVFDTLHFLPDLLSLRYVEWCRPVSIHLSGSHRISHLSQPVNLGDCLSLLTCSTKQKQPTNVLILSRVSEQYTPPFTRQTSVKYLKSQPSRVSKLIQNSLGTPSNISNAYTNCTVQTVRPLLKVHAFSELIQGALHPNQNASFQRQSWCATLKFFWDVDLHDFFCIPAKKYLSPLIASIQCTSFRWVTIAFNHYSSFDSFRVTVESACRNRCTCIYTAKNTSIIRLVKASYRVQRYSEDSISYDWMLARTDTITETDISRCSASNMWSTRTKERVGIQDRSSRMELIPSQTVPPHDHSITSSLCEPLKSGDFKTKGPFCRQIDFKRRHKTVRSKANVGKRTCEPQIKKSKTTGIVPMIPNKCKNLTATDTNKCPPKQTTLQTRKNVGDNRRRQWSAPPIRSFVNALLTGRDNAMTRVSENKKANQNMTILPIAGDVLEGGNVFPSDTYEKTDSSLPTTTMSGGKTRSHIIEPNSTEHATLRPPQQTRSRIPVPIQPSVTTAKAGWGNLASNRSVLSRGHGSSHSTKWEANSDKAQRDASPKASLQAMDVGPRTTHSRSIPRIVRRMNCDDPDKNKRSECNPHKIVELSKYFQNPTRDYTQLGTLQKPDVQRYNVISHRTLDGPTRLTIPHVVKDRPKAAGQRPGTIIRKGSGIQLSSANNFGDHKKTIYLARRLTEPGSFATNNETPNEPLRSLTKNVRVGTNRSHPR
ncbi:hypothetical protein PHET_05394 [Paragonimus heterotremus]|uniref:DUF4537 domain-containing protein n=1 Tax=Paragonimus heterotremus TaxID=100268 RepID=A0A8J4WIN6_9TREM|nr:hypothetical protein PHET_05394 [Paragonimus heterotremus]